MAKRAPAGALRTRIQIFDYPRDERGEPARDRDGYPAQGPVNVYGPGAVRHCRWVNAHGREAYEARQAGVTEPATLTLRYSPRLTATCLIYRHGDPAPYEVVSVDDVENRHTWIEVKVQRKTAKG